MKRLVLFIQHFLGFILLLHLVSWELISKLLLKKKQKVNEKNPNKRKQQNDK